MFKNSFASALAPPTPSQQFLKKRSVLATSAKIMGQGPFDSTYYLKGALAGGICCSITHGARLEQRATPSAEKLRNMLRRAECMAEGCGREC